MSQVVCFFSLQRLFNQKGVVIGKFLCRKDNVTISVSNIPPLNIKYAYKSYLLAALIKHIIFSFQVILSISFKSN